MVLISWFDAVSYCRWRSHSEGRAYRLLSGDEWEKAARGVDGRRFPWGDRFDASFCKMSQSRPPPRRLESVGAFAIDESPYGVRDMAGGVSGWTASWYDRERSLRLVRGGSWVHDQERCHAAARFGLSPQGVYPWVGFRLCLPLQLERS